MTILTAIILGLIQALGEFLPISSSAHLALFPYVVGEVYQGITFDVALHLATLIAVIAYFWRDLFNLARAGLTRPKTDDGRLFWYIGIATVPAAVFGYFARHAAEEAFRSPLLIALMLVIFAGVLMFADKYNARRAEKKQVFTLAAMLLIGMAQALAVMPGVSRSGITISMALLLGYGRAAGARVSFLLSIPIIAGAAVLKLRHITLADIDTAFAAGFLTALVGGWLAIKFLMKYIQTHNFNIFVYYRWALGAAIIALYLLRGA